MGGGVGTSGDLPCTGRNAVTQIVNRPPPTQALESALPEARRKASTLGDADLKDAFQRAVTRWELFVEELGRGDVAARDEFVNQTGPRLIRLLNCVDKADDPEIVRLLREFCAHEPQSEVTGEVIERLDRKGRCTGKAGILNRFMLAMDDAMAAQADEFEDVRNQFPENGHDRRVGLGRIYELKFDGPADGPAPILDAEGRAAVRQKWVAFGRTAAQQAVAAVAADFLLTAITPGENGSPHRLNPRTNWDPQWDSPDTSLLQRKIFLELERERNEPVVDTLPEIWQFDRLFVRGNACWVEEESKPRLPELGDLEKLVKSTAGPAVENAACLVAQHLFLRYPSAQTIAAIAKAIPQLTPKAMQVFITHDQKNAPMMAALNAFVSDPESGAVGAAIQEQLIKASQAGMSAREAYAGRELLRAASRLTRQESQPAPPGSDGREPALEAEIQGTPNGFDPNAAPMPAARTVLAGMKKLKALGDKPLPSDWLPIFPALLLPYALAKGKFNTCELMLKYSVPDRRAWFEMQQAEEQDRPRLVRWLRTALRRMFGLFAERTWLEQATFLTPDGGEATLLELAKASGREEAIVWARRMLALERELLREAALTPTRPASAWH